VRVARASKYRAVPTEVDGIKFPSKKEATRWQQLRLLERAGQISQLTRQVPYDLFVNGKKVCRYVSDFNYYEGDQLVVEDSKGMPTPTYRLKKKLMDAVYNIQIRET
jgi:hypothetical protein